MTRSQLKLALITEQRCPKCNKLKQEFDDVISLLGEGMCCTCSKVLVDYYEFVNVEVERLLDEMEGRK
jgi:hypothetical protein